MDGLGLLGTLIEASGLPRESIEPELLRLMKERDYSPERLTLPEVREILAAYLQEILVAAKDAENN
ncbi:MAG: hypothetical protein AB7G93_02005 [Bdellovibrionales bacterium]